MFLFTVNTHSAIRYSALRFSYSKTLGAMKYSDPPAKHLRWRREND